MPDVDREFFLSQVSKIKQANNNGHRAPHKPLLLLLALSAVQNDEERLIGYSNIDERLGPLLRDFGPPTRSQQPNTYDPFRRLPNDGLWELIDQQESPIVKPLAYDRKDLISEEIRGGFPVHIRELLTRDKTLAFEAAQLILHRNWPPSQHEDILSAVGLSNMPANIELGQAVQERETQLSKSVKRDPQFREIVLRAYERSCAVCRYDLRLGNSPLGLEAAHIMWHAHGGPDVENNGLALCTFHHKAFDKGAFMLASFNDQYRIVVSQELSGSEPAKQLLTNFHGLALNPPQDLKLSPNEEFTRWHQEEVFRGPGKPLA